MNILKQNEQLLFSCGPVEGLQAEIVANLHLTNLRLAEAMALASRAVTLARAYGGDNEATLSLRSQIVNLGRDVNNP